MRRFARAAVRFIVDEHGPTMVEYALLIALIVLLVMLAVVPIGQRVLDLFQAGIDAFP